MVRAAYSRPVSSADQADQAPAPSDWFGLPKCFVVRRAFRPRFLTAAAICMTRRFPRENAALGPSTRAPARGGPGGRPVKPVYAPCRACDGRVAPGGRPRYTAARNGVLCVASAGIGNSRQQVQ